MVRAVSPGVFTFNNSLRNEGYSNEDYHRTEQLQQYWIALTYEQQYSEVLIDYRSNTSLANDYRYDEENGNRNTWISLYTVNENNYKIESRGAFNEDDIIYLGYNANVSGNFTLSSDGFTNFEGYNLMLFDSEFGTFHNLETPYSFNTEVGTFEDRFILVYQTTLETEELTHQGLFVFPNPVKDTLYIEGEISSRYNIIDSLGRIIIADCNEIQLDVSNLSKGVYIIKFRTGQMLKFIK